MQRVILHCDMNSFYASCELVCDPRLCGQPVAVGGDIRQRRGIVLSATQEARAYGVKTGMALWQAARLCPRLVTLPARFDRYADFSKRFHAICAGQSPLVESFGLDECWIDLSSPGLTLEEGVDTANRLRERVKRELGLTVSIGVSWNKVFAKLGSDMKKPDAVTLISPENYQSLVWPLPVSALLFIGPRTVSKLSECGIFTIGDIALSPPGLMQAMLGRSGALHRRHARGQDTSPVTGIAAETAVKSVGNSTTTPEDMTTPEEVRRVLTVLSESVSTRLRKGGLAGKCIGLSIRDSKLYVRSCQTTIGHATALCGEIIRSAMDLFFRHGYERFLPLRSVGISVEALCAIRAPEQLDLFGEARRREKELSLAETVDRIRQRYGPAMIRRGTLLSGDPLPAVDDHHGDHTTLFCHEERAGLADERARPCVPHASDITSPVCFSRLP